MLKLINHLISKVYSSPWFTVIVGLVGILIGNWLAIWEGISGTLLTNCTWGENWLYNGNEYVYY